MKILKVVNQAVSVMIILMLALPLPVLAQGEGGGSQAALFSKEQLAQMLAPVALFPDALLSQVLMASTYPLEVVEADRWVKKNPGLEGDALDEALVDKEWDPSVKSLCHFPSILSSMSDKIAQTTRLGDAFLGQQDDVMAMVQELRAKAREAGNLKSTKEQNVLVEKETIIIESASPEVVYVPSYDPYYVYGPWWYPAYPPYYWWPRPAIIGAGLVFWPGIHIGLSIGVWSYFDWYNHVIVIDWRRTHKFHRHRGDRDGRDRGDRDRWRHDADHRRGVAYRDRATAQKFGQAPERSRESRRELRGFPERRTMDRQTRESIRQDVERAPMKRGETVQPERGRMREQIDRRERPVMPQKESIFGGGGDARRERMESERGRSSREQFNKGAREVIGPSPGINRGSDSGRGQGGSQGTSKGSSKGQSSGQDGRGDRGRMGR
ncbi:MAG: DUF3300 domain-containing protein [Nitrospirae bacterium]|nr:DUF3300 domain-containing protein [Nitrospirota bacterium]